MFPKSGKIVSINGCGRITPYVLIFFRCVIRSSMTLMLRRCCMELLFATKHLFCFQLRLPMSSPFLYLLVISQLMFLN